MDEYERGNATKYHAVKHFERKKSERKLKQAQKQLEAATDEDNKQALEEKVKECEIKVQYVLVNSCGSMGLRISKINTFFFFSIILKRIPMFLFIPKRMKMMKRV